jgi:hypothetical protein
MAAASQIILGMDQTSTGLIEPGPMRLCEVGGFTIHIENSVPVAWTLVDGRLLLESYQPLQLHPRPSVQFKVYPSELDEHR